MLRYSWIFLLILCMGVVTSDNGVYNTNLEFKKPCFNNGTWCSSDTVCNLTIRTPSQISLINNSKMTNQLSYHNITTPNLTELGYYNADMVCCSSSGCGSESFNIYVSNNGKNEASPSTVIFFSIIFLVLVSCCIYASVYSIEHLLKLDYDAKDFSISLGVYAFLLGAFMLSKNYWGDPVVDSMMGTFILIGRYTNGLIPIIAFTISMIVGTLFRKGKK